MDLLLKILIYFEIFFASLTYYHLFQDLKSHKYSKRYLPIHQKAAKASLIATCVCMIIIFIISFIILIGG